MVTQWVTNLRRVNEVGISEIESPHSFQVCIRISAAKLALQSFSQEIQRSLAVPGSTPASLFVLDNLPTDEPIADDLRGIDRASGCDAGQE
jgi:hypothetical protein